MLPRSRRHRFRIHALRFERTACWLRPKPLRASMRRTTHPFACICAEAGLVSCYCTILISFFLFSVEWSTWTLFSLSFLLTSIAICWLFSAIASDWEDADKEMKKNVFAIECFLVGRYRSFACFVFWRSEENRLRLGRGYIAVIQIIMCLFNSKKGDGEQLQCQRINDKQMNIGIAVFRFSNLLMSFCAKIAELKLFTSPCLAAACVRPCALRTMSHCWIDFEAEPLLEFYRILINELTPNEFRCAMRDLFSLKISFEMETFHVRRRWLQLITERCDYILSAFVYFRANAGCASNEIIYFCVWIVYMENL